MTTESPTRSDHAPADTASSDTGHFAQDWERWHSDHERRRADPHGFLAVTGLYWLDEQPTVPVDAPGSWTTGPQGPVIELPEGESLTLGDRTITGRYAFGPIAERGGVTVGFNDGVIEVARRGGRDILRPRRPDHPFLAGYSGTPTYVPNPRWRVPARFTAAPDGNDVEVGAAVEGISHIYPVAGYLDFDWQGETFRLTAFPGHAPETLSVLLTDATSGLTTYAANRSVTVELADDTVIDFNRAVNLPCAYTDLATCPLPPTENRLPIGIEAGEKTPLARVEGVLTDRGILAAHTADHPAHTGE